MTTSNSNDETDFFDLFEKLSVNKSGTAHSEDKFRVAPRVFERFLAKHRITNFTYGQAGAGRDSRNTRFQFDAMAKRQDWDKQERREMFLDFCRMLWTELDSRYNLQRLDAMQAICVFYDLTPRDSPPVSEEECRALIDTLYVNIFHFADGNKTQFKSFKELKRFSIDKDMIYPLDAAKENPVLKSLLKDFR